MWVQQGLPQAGQGQGIPPPCHLGDLNAEQRMDARAQEGREERGGLGKGFGSAGRRLVCSALGVLRGSQEFRRFL